MSYVRSIIMPPPPRSTLFPYTTLFRSTVGQTASSAVGQQLGELGTEVTRKNLSIQPTVKIPIGYRFNVRVNRDRKSTRLNSSHTVISYAVFCLKKKRKNKIEIVPIMTG